MTQNKKKQTNDKNDTVVEDDTPVIVSPGPELVATAQKKQLETSNNGNGGADVQMRVRDIVASIGKVCSNEIAAQKSALDASDKVNPDLQADGCSPVIFDDKRSRVTRNLLVALQDYWGVWSESAKSQAAATKLASDITQTLAQVDGLVDGSIGAKSARALAAMQAEIAENDRILAEALAKARAFDSLMQHQL